MSAHPAPFRTHRRVWRWRPAAAAVAQLLASAAVADAFGPKWGLVAALVAVVIQSQLRPVARKEPTHVPPELPKYAVNATTSRGWMFAPPSPRTPTDGGTA